MTGVFSRPARFVVALGALAFGVVGAGSMPLPTCASVAVPTDVSTDGSGVVAVASGSGAVGEGSGAAGGDAGSGVVAASSSASATGSSTER